MRRLVAIAITLALIAEQSHAQIRPGFPTARSGLTILTTSSALLPCQVTNNGVAPSLCADFQDAVYTLNGTSYASLTAMGGTIPSGCTLSAGNGLYCAGSGVAASIAAGNPGSGYMIVTVATEVYSGTSTSYYAAELSDGTNLLSAYQYGSQDSCATATSNAHDSSTAFGETVLYAGSTSGATCTFTAAGAQATLTGTTPSANATLYIAGAPSQNPTNTPYYVKSVRIYPGTFTTAQQITAAKQ